MSVIIAQSHAEKAREDQQFYKVIRAVELATGTTLNTTHGPRTETLDFFGRTLSNTFFHHAGYCSSIGCMNKSDCPDCSPSDFKKHPWGEPLTLEFLRGISKPESGCCQAIGCHDTQNIEWKGLCCSRICHNSSQRLKITPTEELLVKLNEIHPECLLQAIFQMMWISYPTF